MIISLGYRVKSSIATRFRRWATERLKFQVKELSPVERSYLESIRTVSRIAKRKARAGGK